MQGNNPTFADLRERHFKLLYQEGKVSEALALLKEGIKVHANKIGIKNRFEQLLLDHYVRAGETDLEIKMRQKLFAEGRDIMTHYRALKQLIDVEEWKTILPKLTKSYNFGDSATSYLSEIYFEEKAYDQLFEVLKNARYNLLSALEKYARCLNTEQQQVLVSHLERELKGEMKNAQPRKEYHVLADKLIKLKHCCPAGRDLTDKLLVYYQGAYANRPAMMQELNRVK